MPIPTIALSAHWNTYPERFDWIVEHGFAIEYSPNPQALDLLPVHLDPLLKAGIPVRYHGFFPRHEIGQVDAASAERAMDVHLSTLEAMHGRGEQIITVHIGLDRQAPLDFGRVVANLTRLVERARELDIVVCLENLRRGPTSDPETVVEWARKSGSMITLDVGHAVSCQRVSKGDLTPLDFIEAFQDRLFEVHMYERETDRHHPPQDMIVLGPIVDRLLSTTCTWWTIELNDYDQVLATRTLLLDYMRTETPS
jgi:sugar phosphate isomerase/epimerase